MLSVLSVVCQLSLFSAVVNAFGSSSVLLLILILVSSQCFRKSSPLAAVCSCFLQFAIGDFLGSFEKPSANMEGKKKS